MTRIAGTVRILVALALICGRAAAVGADQPTRSSPALDLQLRPGETVFVVDTSARETTGIVAQVSPSSLRLVVQGEARELTADEIGFIEKRGDSVGNGIRNTLLASAPIWTMSTAFGCAVHGAPCGGAAVAALAPWAIAGAIVDWAIKGRRVVYHADPHAAGGPVTRLGSLWMRARSGDTLRISDERNNRVSGSLIEVSANSILVWVGGQEQAFEISNIREISKPGDSVWNGALIGAAFGIFEAGRYLQHDWNGGGEAALVLLSTTFYGGIGAGIDALIPGHTTIYRARPAGYLRVSPLVRGHTRGLALTIGF